jgi:hypothetical protein
MKLLGVTMHSRTMPLMAGDLRLRRGRALYKMNAKSVERMTKIRRHQKAEGGSVATLGNRMSSSNQNTHLLVPYFSKIVTRQSWIFALGRVEASIGINTRHGLIDIRSRRCCRRYLSCRNSSTKGGDLQDNEGKDATRIKLHGDVVQ